MNQNRDGCPTRRATAKLLPKHDRRNVAESDAPIFLGDAQTEETKLSHFIEQFTWDGTGLLPILYVGDNLALDELPNTDANRLEILADVDRPHSSSSVASSARPALLL